MMNNAIKVHYASPGLYEHIVLGLKAIGNYLRGRTGEFEMIAGMISGQAGSR